MTRIVGAGAVAALAVVFVVVSGMAGFGVCERSAFAMGNNIARAS